MPEHRERMRDLRVMLLTPDGPARIYDLYFKLFRNYPGWGQSPNEVMRAIAATENDLTQGEKG